jgi:hypothetical protein
VSDVGLIGILEVTPARETLSPRVDIPSSVLMLSTGPAVQLAGRLFRRGLDGETVQLTERLRRIVLHSVEFDRLQLPRVGDAAVVAQP